MTHYRMQDNEPSAIILAKNPMTSSLDELKTYQGNTIFLNNGDEFQIRLFNPLREKIGIQIGINGDLSGSFLVLNPGEDVTLDRFLDDKSKMIFETYVYDANNKSASNAVVENGIVDIKFFKEKKIYRKNKVLKSSKDSQQFYGDFGMCDARCISGQNLFDDDISNNVYFSASLDYSNKTLISSSICNLDFVSDSIPEEKKETGRVEKGDESTQDFKQVEIQFESFPFHTLQYYLKPTSERNITDSKTYTSTKVREYCTNCGFRRRSSVHNFCPKCGDKY